MLHKMEEHINFHRNKGSWCATNVLSELERLDNRLGCLCGVLKFKYLREVFSYNPLSLL